MSAAGTATAKKSASKEPTVVAATITNIAKASEEKLAKARAAVTLDTEQIADAVVTSKPKVKKTPASLNLMPTPKTAKPAKAVKPAPVANGSVAAGRAS
jgi:hypothetical protein